MNEVLLLETSSVIKWAVRSTQIAQRGVAACFVIFPHVKYQKKSGPYETNGFSPDRTPETGNEKKHRLECWPQSSFLPNSDTPCMGLTPVPDREP